MRRILALLLVLCIAAGVLAGCGAKADTPAKPDAPVANQNKEEIVLELWLADASVGDSTLPENEWWITGIIQEFEDQNPGIKIELTVPSGQVEITQTYKTAFTAGTEPDIVNLWSGTNLFPLKDLCMDVTEYIPAEDFEKIIGWSECYMDFDTTQKLLAIPLAQYGFALTNFSFNKTIFDEVGIDPTAIVTIEDLEAAMQKLQDAGYLPLAVDDEGYGVLYSVIGLAWANEVDNDGIYANSIGESKFADDETFIATLELGKKWFDQGWLNQDYATSTTALSNFLTGKAAMFIGGSWFADDIAGGLGAENAGVLMMPSFAGAKHQYTSLGGNGQCLVVSANCEHPAEAVKFISFMNSQESTIKAMAQREQIPVRTDVEYSKVGTYYDQLIGITSNPCYYYDNSMRADVVTEFYRLWPQIVTGAVTIDEAVTTLDNLAANGG